MNRTTRIIAAATLLFASSVSIPLFANTPSARTQVGTAVYYSDKMDGRVVSLKGEHYDKNGLTAATHGRFPLGSMLKVTNLSNNKTVTVKVTDRMNPKSRSVVDLSRKAAEEIDMLHSGHTRVRLELVDAH